MAKKLFGFITFTVALFCMISAVFASEKWPATSGIKTYVLTTKNDTKVYKDAKSQDGSYGTIYADDLITIDGYSGSRLKVTYPIKNGTKTGYIEKSAVTNGTIDKAIEKWKAASQQTTYRRSDGETELGYVSKGDVCYTIYEKNGYKQIIYPISGGYKMGWIKVNEGESGSSDYIKKVNAFLSKSDYKNGATWGASKKPILSSYSCSGCCAYAADFVKYVFGKNSPTSGTSFKNPGDIRAGDVIKVTNTQHWFVVISRNGNSLKVAEGNWDGKVVVSNGTYTIEKNTLYRNGKKFRTFSAGYHFK